MEVGDVPTNTELEATCFSLMTSIYRTVSPCPTVTDPASVPTTLGTASACAVPAGWKIPAPTFSAVLEIERCCKGPVASSHREGAE